MVSATSLLRKEHAQIVRAANVAVELARRLERGGPVPVNSLPAVLQYFSFVAHRCHRDKEEDLLFPMLRDKGLYEGPGCIGLLLDQHQDSVRAFESMAAAAEAFSNGDRCAATGWVQAVREYTEALRRHIRHEEEVLLMNAERLLTDQDQQDLAREFERIDSRAQRAGLDEIMEDFERVAKEVGY